MTLNQKVPNLTNNICSLPPIPRPPRASLTLLHMSTTLSFFQTLSVAPLTLLVSAGGMAAASKRPFLLSGSICCVSTSFLLRGEAQKIL
jgi:hypothetical protein